MPSSHDRCHETVERIKLATVFGNLLSLLNYEARRLLRLMNIYLPSTCRDVIDRTGVYPSGYRVANCRRRQTYSYLPSRRASLTCDEII